jgi:hypothetical protein
MNSASLSEMKSEEKPFTPSMNGGCSRDSPHDRYPGALLNWFSAREDENCKFVAACCSRDREVAATTKRVETPFA